MATDGVVYFKVERKRRESAVGADRKKVMISKHDVSRR